MKLLDYTVKMTKKTDRFELFPFGDCHIGKRNCNEDALRKQIREVLRRAERPDRQVRVILGGDICDCVKPGDLRRYNCNTLPDWMLKGSAETIRDRLQDVAGQQLKRATGIFKPISHLAIGAIEGNHEFGMMHRENVDFQGNLCRELGVPNLTDEAVIRIRFEYWCRKKTPTVSTIILYIQHGHGGGRSVGSEPKHLDDLLSEWECADVVMRGHSHTFCELPPKPVFYLPRQGALPPEPLVRHRYAANWGAWLNSHTVGPSTYESRAAYRIKAMMTIKVVVWPFYRVLDRGQDKIVPKIELRKYPIL